MSEHHDPHAGHHVSPVSLYWSVWGGLMVFTVITVLAYYIPLRLKIDLGAGNVIIAMAIATTKATLVVLFFMGLKYDKKFLAIAFLSSLIFLGLFLAFTLLDVNTREDQLPFAKPIYAGKEIPLEGGHSAEGAKPGEAPAATHTEGAAGAAPAASPAASHAAGEAKTEEAKPAAAATPAAKH